MKVADLPGMRQGTDFNQNWKATQQHGVVMVVFTAITAVRWRHVPKTGALAVEPKLSQWELVEGSTLDKTVRLVWFAIISHSDGPLSFSGGITVPGSFHLPLHPSSPEPLLRPWPPSPLQSRHQTGILQPSPTFSRQQRLASLRPAFSNPAPTERWWQTKPFWLVNDWRWFNAGLTAF